MKRKILYGVLLVCFCFILGGCRNNDKKDNHLSGEEILEKLEDNDFLITYSFYSDGETYDHKGKCYDYNLDEVDCSGKIGLYEITYIDITNKNGDENLSLIFSTTENKIDSLFYNVYVARLNSAYTSYYLTRDGKEEIGHYKSSIFSTDSCYYVVKSEKDVDEKCTKSGEEKIKEFKSRIDKLLEDTGITTNDLFIFADYYYYTYMTK